MTIQEYNNIKEMLAKGMPIKQIEEITGHSDGMLYPLKNSTSLEDYQNYWKKYNNKNPQEDGLPKTLQVEIIKRFLNCTIRKNWNY